MMMLSVRYCLFNSVIEYAKTKRTEWVKEHPGQCILNGSQVVWTSEVEEAISKSAVKQYFEKLEKQLGDLVFLVR